MEIIKSKDNKKVKEARKLLNKKYRKESYLIEGFHLFEEAVKFSAPIKQIFIEEEKLDLVKDTDNLTVVSPEVLKSLSETESPQGIVAVVEKTEPVTDFSSGKFLILENVQDPGNVGTMVRTADAAGYKAVILTGKSADIYSPKVMRAMQGSNFHLPVLYQSEQNLFDSLKANQIELLVTTLAGESVSHKVAKKTENFALLMGNEGQGASSLAVGQADQLLHIDMAGQAESLNVAVAAGILMFSL